jgi:hypothetical protein
MPFEPLTSSHPMKTCATLGALLFASALQAAVSTESTSKTGTQTQQPTPLAAIKAPKKTDTEKDGEKEKQPQPAAPAQTPPQKPAAAANSGAQSAAKPSANVQSSVLRINATTQAFDFVRPWSKKNPTTRRAIGTVVLPRAVLTTADFLANATYIEMESPRGDFRVPAQIVAIDYEANLALLTPEDATGNFPFQPIELAEVKRGDSIEAVQLEPNGNLSSTKGTTAHIDVARYWLEDQNFLVYRFSGALQIRDGSATLPVFANNRLAGLLMRYDPASNIMECVSAPVARHFLRDVADGSYQGFAKSGMAFSATRDPQFRSFLKISNVKGGVYVSSILKDGPADQAGIKKGDVITQIDGQDIDSDANYNDANYGRISISHLISTSHQAGDILKVEILRDGKPISTALKPSRKPPEAHTVPPYVISKGPKFVIVGGLILQELSRQMLKEWGNDWHRKAPIELLNLDRTQNESNLDIEHHVILTQIIPSELTIGYQEVNFVAVTEINGTKLRSIADVPDALAKPIKGTHHIKLAGDPGILYLDASKTVETTESLQKAYGIPFTSRLR